MKKTTLYIPEDLALAVNATAKRKHTSEAAIIREAISSYLATEESPLPTFIGLVAVDGVEGKDTEDWLLANWRPE